MTLGEFILAARTERGLTQAELGERCQVSGAEISRLEAGKRRAPSPKILRAISKALVVDYSQLMRLAGYEEEIHEEEKTFEKVFRNEDGEIVDITRGIREMVDRDYEWAHLAYRASRELNDTERNILGNMISGYLENSQKKQQE